MVLDITAPVIISFVALVFTILYNSRTWKNTDVKQAEERAKRDERTDNKLDQIFDAISNLKDMVSGMQARISQQETDIKRVSHKFNVLEGRVEQIEKALNLHVVITRGVEEDE